MRCLVDQDCPVKSAASFVAQVTDADRYACRDGRRVLAFPDIQRPSQLSRWTRPCVGFRSRRLLPAAYAALLLAVFVAAGAAQDQSAKPSGPMVFRIPAQSLASALQAYGQTTGIQVLYESNSAVGRTSVAVEGRFAADAALNLVLKGTDLRVRYIRPDAITLAPPSVEGVNRAPPAVPLAASDLSLGTLRVRGSSGNDGRLQDYSQGVQMDIQNALRKNPRTRDGSYRAVLDLWIDSARTIERTELFRSTGDRDRDAAVAATLRGVTISRPAPANLPQPVRVGIVVNALQ